MITRRSSCAARARRPITIAPRVGYSSQPTCCLSTSNPKRRQPLKKRAGHVLAQSRDPHFGATRPSKEVTAMTDQPTGHDPQDGTTPLDLTDAGQAAWLAMLALKQAVESGQRPADLDPLLADMETIVECLRAVVAATVEAAPPTSTTR